MYLAEYDAGFKWFVRVYFVPVFAVVCAKKIPGLAARAKPV